LEVADQVKARAGEAGNFGGFGFEFLDVVFAELAETKGIRRVDGIGGKDFGDCQEQNFRGIAAGAGGGAFDAEAYRGEPFG
jgi:hypothetical protein